MRVALKLSDGPRSRPSENSPVPALLLTPAPAPVGIMAGCPSSNASSGRGKGSRGVDLWSKNTLKSVLVPGGVVWFAAIVAASSRHLLSFSFRRYHLLLGCLSCRISPGLALSFQPRLLCGCEFAPGPPRLNIFFCWASGVAVSGHTALEAIAFLLPPNLLLLALVHERGLTLASIRLWLGLLFVESVFVAVLCRPGATSSPWFLHFGFLPKDWFHWTRLPPSAWMTFAITFMHLAGPSSSLPQAG